MGCERARYWVSRWPLVQRSLDIDTVLQQVIASDAAERLGVSSAHISSKREM